MASLGKDVYKRGSGSDIKENNQVNLSQPCNADGHTLTILSLNMEYYRQYTLATNKLAYETYLKEKLEGVDVLCVQEDLLSRSDQFMNPTKPFDGYSRIVSSFKEQAAFDKLAKEKMLTLDDTFTSTLGNSIYLKNGLEWAVDACKVVQISSPLELPNGTLLQYRCVVCATLTCAEAKPVQVLCTHLSGGRYEDVFCNGVLKRERAHQMETCLNQKQLDTYNILVGDFNASPTRTPALDNYCTMLQKNDLGLSPCDYYKYMMAPFATLATSKDWNLLYDTMDGPTSMFGHVIDFFVTSPHLQVQTNTTGQPRIERIRMIKNYFTGVDPTADDEFKDSHLEESITDHNGVKVTFFLSRKDIIEKTQTFRVDPTKKWGSFKECLPLPCDQYPIVPYPVLQYKEGTQGPQRVGKGNDIFLVHLINRNQGPLFEEFCKSDFTTATLMKFLSDSAAEERTLLTAHGWQVVKGWYILQEEDNEVLVLKRRITTAHYSFHEQLLTTKVLRKLKDLNMLVHIK